MLSREVSKLGSNGVKFTSHHLEKPLLDLPLGAKFSRACPDDFPRYSFQQLVATKVIWYSYCISKNLCKEIARTLWSMVKQTVLGTNLRRQQVTRSGSYLYKKQMKL